MRFQVPQFIEVEDKIFGPLTIKQFIYLTGGGGLGFIVYRFSSLPFFFTIFLVLPPVLLGVALAFYKPNSKSFVSLLESMFHFYLGSKLYIWKKTPKKVAPKEEKSQTGDTSSTMYVPKMSDSKLKDLTWSLDITENTNPGANESMDRR